MCLRETGVQTHEASDIFIHLRFGIHSSGQNCFVGSRGERADRTRVLTHIQVIRPTDDSTQTSYIGGKLKPTIDCAACTATDTKIIVDNLID